ncbi:hypothetical protein EVAR_41833_1 [Eumeta japonica]|uniref:Uncharacterized protein n=1 Tax=Eumeta variegata TaxID=151549 RepID=A0A4C1XAE8_EUMVA|nr:hypothetical protein EVAR_41833_1 [Eumeta japonica]
MTIRTYARVMTKVILHELVTSDEVAVRNVTPRDVCVVLRSHDTPCPSGARAARVTGHSRRAHWERLGRGVHCILEELVFKIRIPHRVPAAAGCRPGRAGASARWTCFA